MANTVFNGFKEGLMNGDQDLSAANDAYRVILLTDSYTPDPDDTHIEDLYTTAITEVEATGQGYDTGTTFNYTSGTAKGLQNMVVDKDNTGDRGTWDADDITWASSTITARYGLIYKVMGDATTDQLCVLIDFGSDKSSSAGDFTIQWNTDGILTLT